VARVQKVDRLADTSFAKITLSAISSANSVRHVLVVKPMGEPMQVRPAPEAPPPPQEKPARKGVRK
jgi:rod shape-determining protein MreC